MHVPSCRPAAAATAARCAGRRQGLGAAEHRGNEDDALLLQMGSEHQTREQAALSTASRVAAPWGTESCGDGVSSSSDLPINTCLIIFRPCVWQGGAGRCWAPARTCLPGGTPCSSKFAVHMWGSPAPGSRLRCPPGWLPGHAGAAAAGSSGPVREQQRLWGVVGRGRGQLA